MTDALLQTMPAGDPGGMNAGICGLSGELVVLLFAWIFVSGRCDGLLLGAATASRGVSDGEAGAVTVALLQAEAASAAAPALEDPCAGALALQLLGCL